MKTLYLSIIFLITINNCYAQKNNKTKDDEQTEFMNEYYKYFDECSLPFYTQKINLHYSSLKSKHNMIPKNLILKYIGNCKDDIGFDYVSTNGDTQEEISGFAEYDYFYLCKYKSNNFLFLLYIKDQGSDSTLIYIASYNNEGKNIDKLKLHGFMNDTELIKSVINSDSKITVFKYKPIDNFKKTKITINNYNINNYGKFELINKEQKEGKYHFTDYRGRNKNPDDDPINQY